MADRKFNLPQLKRLRTALRNHMTEPELRLWQRLRGEQLGVKFRRQHGIGVYIVDFYCPACRLVIEVDGDSHFSEQALLADATRDAFISSLGLRGLRFSNREVMTQLDAVLTVIANHLK